MADKTIYDLTENQSLDAGDLFEQDVLQNNERKSLKTSLGAIAEKINTSLTYSGLNTTSKTVVGAINELEQGGGTGGHTIIDENGTSMTARAGLQFVGGANVSDDSTNNKTIVDLASAGGIDGVFIDTGNIIQSETSVSVSSSSSPTYTATEDCCILIYFGSLPSGSNFTVRIDDVGYCYFASNENGKTFPIFVKKGQEIKFTATQSVTVYYTVYGIQTGTTHSKFQPVIYSTEEREIGVWTDGKPLYQKTIPVSFQTSDNEISISEPIDKFMFVPEGTFKIQNLSNNVTNYGFYYSSGDRVQAYYRYNDKKIIILNVSSNIAGDGYITYRYTKTTDTAGSGTWTPQGVPAHHYSTDEQVIGTWFDGSTIYEKSFVFDTPIEIAYNSPTNTSIDSSEMDIIISAIGIHADGTNYGTFVADPTRSSHTVLGLTTPRNNNSATIKYLTLQYTKSS